MGPQVYRVLEHGEVEGGGLSDDLVLVWPEGRAHVEQYPRSELTPVDLPAEDPPTK